jgi:small subunit ribosomal protein S6
MIVYESTVILSPELTAEKTEEFVEKFKKLVENSKGKIVLSQMLGKKKLAYPIKKFREGNYIYCELSGPGTMIAVLESFYKVTDSVIRYMTVKVDKKPVAPKPIEPPKPVDAEQAAPAQPAQAENQSAQSQSAREVKIDE